MQPLKYNTDIIYYYLRQGAFYCRGLKTHKNITIDRIHEKLKLLHLKCTKKKLLYNYLGSRYTIFVTN